MATLIGSTAYETAGSSALAMKDTASDADLTVTVTGANQSIVVWVMQADTLTRTFSVSSSLDGALEEVGYYNPSAAVGVWLLRDATIGTHTLPVTTSTAGASFHGGAQVIEDLGTGTILVDTQDAATNGSSHVSGATGVTTSTATFVICVGCLSGSVTTKTPGSGYTELLGPPATGARYAQYRDFASGVTLEQGAFTTTGTTRRNRGLLVAFPEAASGGGGSASGGAFISWFGR